MSASLRNIDAGRDDGKRVRQRVNVDWRSSAADVLTITEPTERCNLPRGLLGPGRSCRPFERSGSPS